MSPTTSINTQLWNALVLVRAVQARVYELDAGCQIEPGLGDKLDPADELMRLLSRAVDDLNDVAIVVDRLPDGSVEQAIARLQAERSEVEIGETSRGTWIQPASPPVPDGKNGGAA